MFLFSEKGLYGVTAWLNGYYSLPPSKVIQFQPLMRRAGSIQAAVVLDFDVGRFKLVLFGLVYTVLNKFLVAR